MNLICVLLFRQALSCVSFSIVSFIDSFDRVFYRHPHKSVREGFLLFPLLSRSLAFVPRDFLISRDQYIHSGGFHPESILYVDWVFKLRLALYYPYVCTYALDLISETFLS